MNLSTAYSTVIKYAAAPEEGIKNFSEQSKEAGSLVNGLSHPDHFFADWLEDHDDPRHKIIRKDLEFREHPDGFLAGIQASGIKALGLDGWNQREINFGNYIKSPYSGLDAYKIHHGNKVYYAVTWKTPGVDYHGHFTPEEFEDYLKELESNQPLEDFN